MLHHGPLCRAAEPPGVYQAHQAMPTPRQEETENAQVWYLEGQEQLIYTQGWEGLREGLARVGPFHLRPKVYSNRRKKVLGVPGKDVHSNSEVEPAGGALDGDLRSCWVVTWESE